MTREQIEKLDLKGLARAYALAPPGSVAESRLHEALVFRVLEWPYIHQRSPRQPDSRDLE